MLKNEFKIRYDKTSNTGKGDYKAFFSKFLGSNINVIIEDIKSVSREHEEQCSTIWQNGQKAYKCTTCGIGLFYFMEKILPQILKYI